MSKNGDTYYGLVAEAYDLYLARVDLGDRAFFADAIRAGGGPALELACGTGRLLVDYAAQGLDVDGVDASHEMLSICADKARARGVRPTLHCQRLEVLELERRYRTLYCPASSFMMLTDPGDAGEALRRALHHLEPGGRLLVPLFLPWRDGAPTETPAGVWRVRREARRPRDGARLLCHERVRYEPDARLQKSEMRNEAIRDGEVVETASHPFWLRWYTPDQAVALLEAAGFAGVHAVRGYSHDPVRERDLAFTVIGRRPA